MTIRTVALIYDDQVRPDTTGGYVRRALEELVQVEHFLPSQLEHVPRRGFDLYLNIDDGLRYRLPADLRPCAWWAIDTHLFPDWYRERAPDFNFLFTAQRDGSEMLHEAGITTARWLPLACDPEVHRKHELPKAWDFCFVGHLFPGGFGGPRSEQVRLLQQHFPSHYVGQRFFDEMARTYSASRLVFNRSIRSDINMRVFEALACGSLLVTNDLTENGLADLFQDGSHLATYRDADELVDKVRFYLKEEDLREKIAAAGRAEVLARDTYRHRMEWLLAEVERGLAPTAVTVTASSGTARLPESAQQALSGPTVSGTAGEATPVLPACAPELLELVPRSARRILVLGFGTGSLGQALASRQQAEVQSVDLGEAYGPTPAAADLDRGLAVALGGPGFQGPAPPLDAIVCDQIFEYLGDPLAFLRRVRSRLAPGGVVVAAVPTVRRQGIVQLLLDGHWPFGLGAVPRRDPVRFFTRRLIEQLFARAGLALGTVQAIAGPGHDTWQRQGRPGLVSVGGLRVSGLSDEEAEELFTSRYAVGASAAPEPPGGLTSIIIPVHNQLAYTRRCLESIRRHTDEPYELIVVDNGSTDGTADYLRAQPDVTLIENRTNAGFPAACNQGIRAATGQQILLLNNDTLVTPCWLRRLLRALYAAPEVGLAGPCSNLVSGPQQVPVAYDEDLEGLDGFAWDWGKAHNRQLQDTDRLVGFCLLFRREVVDKVGLLDERFGIGNFEDDDYCRRALRAGYRLVIARDAFIHHFGGRTFVGSGVDYGTLLATNRELYRQKWQREQPESQGQAPAEEARVPAQVAGPAEPRVLVVAHVERLRGRMDKSHYYRYEALARRPGVTLFGPGLEGYRPGMSVGEAVQVACGGVWPDVLLHGADLKESGIPLLVGLEEAPLLTAIELLDSWARPERQVAFINGLRFAAGLIQEAGVHLDQYRQCCPAAEFFWTPNAVNIQLFRDWGLPKEYDIILYGAINPEVYPLRARLARLLAQQSEFRFRHVPHPGYYPATTSAADGILTGAALSREINKAWIGIASCSIYSCLLMKYLEIPASKALVAGNLPEHGRSLFGDSFINLSLEQSDEEILASLRAGLADKERLRALTEAAHQRIVREHSTEAFADRVLAIFRDLLARRHAQGRAGTRAPALSRTQVVSAPAAEPTREPAPCFAVRAAPGGGLLLEKRDLPLSLCMIVRDNARTIEACLRSIRPWVDEMIVVDTGSVDNTPQIGERLGARVFHFPWCDSFAAARNESLKHARGRWIFWMDSDDTIDETNGRKLRELALREPEPGMLGYVMQVHCPGPGEDGEAEVTVVDHVKLFRNLPGLRFERRIHEQIIPAIRRAGGQIAWSDVYVVHSGYDHGPEAQERKKERDLHLLHLELEEEPDHPFTLFNLGMTYADTGGHAEAVGYLRRSIAQSGPDESHLRKAYALLAHSLQQLGRHEEAWQACQEGLDRFPQDIELLFRQAGLLHEGGQLAEAVRAYEAILGAQEERHFSSVVRGLEGYLARHNLAVAFTQMGQPWQAEEQWRRVTQEMPRYRPGWRGLGESLLAQGELDRVSALTQQLLADPHLHAEGKLLEGQLAAARGDIAAARRCLEEAAQERPSDPEPLQVLCRLLFERVSPAEAEGPLRRLLALCPADGAAHHNLGTSCLQQGRFTVAADAYRASLRHRPGSAATYVCLGHALRGAGQHGDAAHAWEEALRLDPDNQEAREALGQAPSPQGWTQRPGEAPERAPHILRLKGRTLRLPFSTRGPVDRAILHEVWERDTYGVRDLAEPPATVLDLGAHIGAFAVLAAEAWPGARILACEADPDNFALLAENLQGRRNVEAVRAAVVGEDVPEVEFHLVLDKAAHNSGGGSCARHESWSIRTRVPALWAVRLWQDRHLAGCDLLKLDCEGSEVAILGALAAAGLLASVRLIVGEWHAEEGSEPARQRVKEQLRAILTPTHEVLFQAEQRGREGRFSARLRTPGMAPEPSPLPPDPATFPPRARSMGGPESNTPTGQETPEVAASCG
jgi:FkbM family methyltransferase